jgi:hypothetical protein
MNHLFESEVVHNPFALMFPDPVRDAVANASMGGSNRVIKENIAKAEAIADAALRRKARASLPMPLPETLALATRTRLTRTTKED